MTKSLRTPKPPKFSIGDIVTVFVDKEKGSQYRMPSVARKNGWEHGMQARVVEVNADGEGRKRKIYYCVESIDGSAKDVLRCTSSLLKTENDLVKSQNIDTVDTLRFKNEQLSKKLEDLKKQMEEINQSFGVNSNKLKFYEEVGLQTINPDDKRMKNVFATYSVACESNDRNKMESSVKFAKMLNDFDSQFQNAA